MFTQWISNKWTQLACLVCVAYAAEGMGRQLFDIQRQQLPFGELIFEPMNQFNETMLKPILADSLVIELPKITSMADSHTDDGSVISRHYSATLVEGAWRNRLNNSTMAYLVESATTDVGILSGFAAAYFMSVIVISASKTRTLS